MSKMPDIDPRAWREELGLADETEDVRSHEFLRFMNRLCEALDVDIPSSEWEQLRSLPGCLDYLRLHHGERVGLTAQLARG